MILQQHILKLIDHNPIRLKLAIAMGVTENTIRNYINANNENLTKAAALKVIREVTGLIDSEILTDAKVMA
jgi:hypothetical protein